MSTVAQVQAAAPSWHRLQKPNPRLTGRRTAGTEAIMAWIVEKGESEAALAIVGGTVEPFTCMGASVSRIVALRHPTWPWLVAEEIACEYCGWEGDPATHIADETHVKATVTFRSPNYGIDNSSTPFLEITGNPSVRQIPIPPAAWATGTVPYGITLLTVHCIDLSLTIHQAPQFSLYSLLAKADTTNASPVFGADAGLVLYAGAGFAMSQQLGGVESWRVPLTFRVTDPNYPWNYGFLEDGTWGLLYKPDGSTLYYPMVDPASWIAL